MPPGEFARAVLDWFERAGRKDLPWQGTGDPYRVWVSEIMLQQTQVQTVIPYYQRFLQSFPDLESLAKAPLDEVLHHWSGLGYYARARNLHKAAQIACEQHQGQLPHDIKKLEALPGIGRSTAGAILSLSLNRPHAILDGNVKRVLARHFAIDGWPGQTAVLNRLWELAESHTPAEHTGEYNQAMMDLGSLVCRRSAPECPACPLRTSCQALAQNRIDQLPAPKPKKALPVRSTAFMVVLDQAGAVLLEQRPPTGVWGGLWGFPESAPDQDPSDWCRDQFSCLPDRIERLPSRRHTFSHFHLDITPWLMQLNNPTNRVMDDPARVWYKLKLPDARGLAAPVSRILEELVMNFMGETV